MFVINIYSRVSVSVWFTCGLIWSQGTDLLPFLSPPDPPLLQTKCVCNQFSGFSSKGKAFGLGHINWDWFSVHSAVSLLFSLYRSKLLDRQEAEKQRFVKLFQCFSSTYFLLYLWTWSLIQTTSKDVTWVSASWSWILQLWKLGVWVCGVRKEWAYQSCLCQG